MQKAINKLNPKNTKMPPRIAQVLECALKQNKWARYPLLSVKRVGDKIIAQRKDRGSPSSFMTKENELKLILQKVYVKANLTDVERAWVERKVDAMME
tara:strand:+ start:9068 stop:9361 length:294 start_codon:yes stop_codon:yes gene_type:complete